jgi:hypothetical protein
MIDFKAKAKNKKYYTFKQYREANQLTTLEIVKLIIKRLLDKLN